MVCVKKRVYIGLSVARFARLYGEATVVCDKRKKERR